MPPEARTSLIPRHGAPTMCGMTTRLWLVFLTGQLFALAGLGAATNLVIANFEGTNYGDWTVTGEAFGPGPARGTLPGQMTVTGFQGHGLVNSYHGGDGTKGTLSSPPFKIERKFIGFLIGGGMDADRTCMNLLVDGRVVRTATGPNDQPGGSEELSPAHWEVSEFLGRNGVIQILDQATGGWGHINVDEIIQTDEKPLALVQHVTRDFKITHRYLLLPIKDNAPQRQLSVLVNGAVMVRNRIALADEAPDWWAFMDVSAWRGQSLTLQVDKVPGNSSVLKQIEQSDELKDAANLYREPLRGQLHFSSRRGWNNDPNGLVYFRGEYHLFYQHNPYGWSWGNMHWGHAVSRDLVHWEELGDVLAPDTLGPMFSGSAVVDWQNTSGLGRKGEPPLVLIYTAAGDPTVQCIASSTDGRTFTKLERNPVLPQITGGNRDPKVTWHEPSKRWVMVLYVELPEGQHSVHFFTSSNLREWKLASITKGGRGKDHFLFECPDFFELPVDNDPANKKWVLTAANREYAVGTFDGTTFTPEVAHLPGHFGKGFYAAQTFSDLPASDTRRLQIGWFQTETKGMPFNQSMTIPLELQLVSTPQGLRLTTHPVKELKTLRAKSFQAGPLTLKAGEANPLQMARGELLEIHAEFTPGPTSEVHCNIRGATVSYEATKGEIVVNGHRAHAPLRDGRQHLTIVCDRTGLEVFASDGLTYVPMPVNLEAQNLDLDIKVAGEPVHFVTLEAHQLRSIWK